MVLTVIFYVLIIKVLIIQKIDKLAIMLKYFNILMFALTVHMWLYIKNKIENVLYIYISCLYCLNAYNVFVIYAYIHNVIYHINIYVNPREHMHIHPDIYKYIYIFIELLFSKYLLLNHLPYIYIYIYIYILLIKNISPHKCYWSYVLQNHIY